MFGWNLQGLRFVELGVMSRSKILKSSRCVRKWGSLIACLVAVGTVDGTHSQPSGREPALVAWYTFSEREGTEIHDHSEWHNNGVIVGYSRNEAAKPGLKFDGAGYVSIPSSPSLNLTGPFSLVTSVRGKGADLRFVQHPQTPPYIRRPAYFQVCGDKIYFAYNADVRDSETLSVAKEAHLKSIYPSFFPLWLGEASTNLSSWVDTYTLTEGLEPKLQALSDGIAYEYFGRDGVGVWQVSLAKSNLALNDFKSKQQTDRYDDNGYAYNVEQGNLQVVGDKVYYAFPQYDDGQWQLYTATSRRDGALIKSVRRTETGGWVPSLQVAGNNIYYIYAPTDAFPAEKLFVAKTTLDGENWRVIATLENVKSSGGAFMVANGRLFFEYSELGSQDILRRRSAHLVTGSMDIDGGHVKLVRRGGEHYQVYPEHVQVVGSKVNWSFSFCDPPRPDPNSEIECSVKSWIASSDLEGGTWKEENLRLPESTRPIGSVTRTANFQIVGGKTYYSASESNDITDSTYSLPVGQTRTFFGTSGANLIAKGDSFGIGLSAGLEGSVFINAGQDYLWRGEAPVDTSGTSTVGFLRDDRIQEVAAVYDGHLLKIYIDGELVSQAECVRGPVPNNFPLVLGDGLDGLLEEVRIYKGALDGPAIKRLFQQAQH
jgi:hypothetical protein